MPKRPRSQRNRQRQATSPQKSSESSQLDFAERSIIWNQAIATVQDIMRQPREQRRVLTKRDLITMSKEIPVYRLVDKIATGVSRMDWIIKGPDGVDLEDPKNAKLKEAAEKVEYSLKHPNLELRGKTYSSLVKSLVHELVKWGEFLVEHVPKSGKEKDKDRRLFKLWLVDYTLLNLNRGWVDTDDNDIPIGWFYPSGHSTPSSKVVPLYRDGYAYLTLDASSYAIEGKNHAPDSPLKIAYPVLEEWVKLMRQKSQIVENTAIKTIISIKGLDQQEVEAVARSYDEQKSSHENGVKWIAGEASTLNVTSRSDEELYPGYTDFLLCLVAIAFSLSRRSLSLKEQDNFSVAEVSSDADFQDAILPIGIMISEMFNDIIHEYEPDLYFVLADMEPRKEGDEAARSNLLYDKGQITLNESREMIGLKPVPNGDYYSDGRKLGEPPAKPDQGYGGYGGGDSATEPPAEDATTTEEMPDPWADDTGDSGGFF